MSPEEICSVKDWQNDSEFFDASDKVLLKATDETLESGAVSKATWDELAKHFPDAASQIAVVASIGNWFMFSQLLRSIEIPLEEGADVWPPDGIPPKS